MTTLVAFLLDETGSMEICRDATISGFNEYIQSLKNDKDSKYRFTLVKFDSNHMTTVHDAAKLKNVGLLTRETYVPGANTPLYDAVARIVHDTEKSAGKYKVLVVIMTDGEENASREHTHTSIAELIKAKEKEGWAFMFLGANQDAWSTAQGIGINAACAATFDQANLTGTMRAVHIATSAYAKGVTSRDATLSRYTTAEGDLVTE